MMESMHWPLENVFLSNSNSVYDPSDPPDIQLRMHPAAMLRNCCATLKILECDSWHGFDCVLKAGTYPAYPQLESLRIKNLDCLNSAPWVISYPNLKYLSVKTTCNYIVDTGEQKWKELEKSVGSDVVDLYLLGLPCHIREIAFSLHSLSLRFFGPVIATARPTRLKLSIPTELFTQPIPTYLEDPALTDLESLVLDVEVWVGGWRGDDGDTDVDCFLGYVFSALRRVSAREFTLFLKVGRSQAFPWASDAVVIGEQDDGSDGSEEEDLSEVEIWANGADLDALVHRFFEEVPSLEWVKLSIGLPEGDSQKRAESSR
ncbi:hypothetical protein GSI_11602 [Ganoderma sinense ZZ0214-1]|uniref:F-box domain-containing protein n=1 Tax=Ganoderma sinense ZZ0214-1 TaxID=1077348 RepID=A0A2G8RWF6_9APHY|nr:hypothetical protein GSI_11602 [Ganoderma sinense ZZ0214-1]